MKRKGDGGKWVLLGMVGRDARESWVELVILKCTIKTWEGVDMTRKGYDRKWITLGMVDRGTERAG